MYNKELISTMREIQNFAFTKEKLAKMQGTSFDPEDFMKRVEHTRLTAHRNLAQAFEYEKSKLD